MAAPGLFLRDAKYLIKPIDATATQQIDANTSCHFLSRPVDKRYHSANIAAPAKRNKNELASDINRISGFITYLLKLAGALRLPASRPAIWLLASQNTSQFRGWSEIFQDLTGLQNGGMEKNIVRALT